MAKPIKILIGLVMLLLLIAVATPELPRLSGRSTQTEAKMLVSAIYSAARAYKEEKGEVLLDLLTIGMLPEGRQRYVAGFNPDCVPADTAGASSTLDIYLGAQRPEHFELIPETLEQSEQIVEVLRSFTPCPEPKTKFLAIAVGPKLDGEELDVWTMTESGHLVNQPPVTIKNKPSLFKRLQRKARELFGGR